MRSPPIGHSSPVMPAIGRRTNILQGPGETAQIQIDQFVAEGVSKTQSGKRSTNEGLAGTLKTRYLTQMDKKLNTERFCDRVADEENCQQLLLSRRRGSQVNCSHAENCRRIFVTRAAVKTFLVAFGSGTKTA